MVVFWHLFSRLVRSAFECYRKLNNCVLPLVLLGLALVFKIVWFFWFTSGITRDYGFVKHMFIVLYVLIQIINGTNLGEMSQDFWYFLADTLIFTQICMNECNFSIFNSFTPIILAILSFLLVRGLSANHNDKSRLCLVKTIGKHDAVFLILLYSLVVLILSAIDFFANSYYGALGIVFFLHSLIIFPGLMENRYACAYVSSLIMAFAMIAL